MCGVPVGCWGGPRAIISGEGASSSLLVGHFGEAGGGLGVREPRLDACLTLALAPNSLWIAAGLRDAIGRLASGAVVGLRDAAESIDDSWRGRRLSRGRRCCVSLELMNLKIKNTATESTTMNKIKTQ
jgi:hypothetical protein